jgi:signal transduction histidine kinase
VLLNKTLQSSTLRLAFIYIALFAAAIFGLFGYVYWLTLSYLDNELEHQIGREISLLLDDYRRGGQPALTTTIGRRVADDAFADWVYLLVDASGTPRTGNIASWPPAAGNGSGYLSLPASDAARSTIEAKYQTLPDGSRLLVGRGDPGQGFTRGITIAIGGAVAGIILLATAAGISTSRRSVTRIEMINATSREIMQAGLGRRIPRRGTNDEWDELADNLNSMLDRIEELIEANRQVSDNIAHDLRTPLTRVRGRLERAAGPSLASDQRQKLVGAAIAELDGILQTFASLLRISQIEAQARRAGFRDIDLASLAREVAELFEPAGEEQQVRLDVCAPQPVGVRGDRDLLFDALANLIDNAIKHGGPGTVTVIADAVGCRRIAVADCGRGIPNHEHHNVLRRFYRLEHSRNSPGSGLGLSLVAAVAHLHGAALEMADNRPGLRVELRFPG